ncbi:MAG: PspC domain-containing protein [Candidatus Poribacteria bacterium]|nr:PspC domain-containing protein [Candidatus Poribacteria bacterium]
MDLSELVFNLIFLCWFVIISGVFVFGIIMVVEFISGKRGPYETSPKTETGEPRLVRITDRKMIGGVCAGFAYKFGIPHWIVRVLWVLLMFPLSGTPIIAYFILWGFMPKATEFPEDYDNRTEGH